MRHAVLILIGFIAIGNLSGCGEKPRTTQYYIDNPSEINTVIKRCDDEKQKKWQN